MKKISLLLLPLTTIPFLANCVNSSTEFYTITWNLDNGSSPITERYKKGEMPYYKGRYPSKPDDEHASYTFTNTWSPAIQEVTQDQTYTANYSVSYFDTFLKVTIPEGSNGEFGFTYQGKLTMVDWGDGECSNDVATHVYKKAGDYDIKIVGKIIAIVDFSQKSYLTEIRLGESYEKITENVFTDCSALKKIVLSKNVRMIESPNFINTPLETIEVNIENPYYTSRNSDCIIEKETATLLYGSSSTTLIPTEVLAIGNSAFEGRIGLEEITFSNSVMAIGKHAFGGCPSLTSVTLPNSITFIDEEAFQFCPLLSSFAFPDHVDSLTLGKHIFRGCLSLHFLTLPEGLTEIPDYAFGADTFDKDISNHEITISLPSTLKSIGKCAFGWMYHFTLASPVLPDALDSIGDRAFYWTGVMLEFVLPASLTYVGSAPFAFANSEFYNLRVYSKADAPGKNWDPGWSAGVSCSEIYFGYIEQEEKSVDGNYKFLALKNGAIITDYDSKSGGEDVVIPDKLTSAQFGEKPVTRIHLDAFKNYKDITSLTMPDTITFIENGSFSGCGKLTTVKLPNQLECISRYTFNECSNLNNVVIPDKVSTIETYAFAYCTKLKTLTITKNCDLTEIGIWSFARCEALESVCIPGKVTSIRSNAFSYCENLKTVDLTAFTSESSDDIPFREHNSFSDCHPDLKFEVASEKMYEAFKNATNKNWPTEDKYYNWPGKPAA